MKKYEPFEAKCTKTVMTEVDKGESLSFLEGEIYKSNFPEVWPDYRQSICLIDHQGDDHFMDWKWFHEHFKKL